MANVSDVTLEFVNIFLKGKVLRVLAFKENVENGKLFFLCD